MDLGSTVGLLLPEDPAACEARIDGAKTQPQIAALPQRRPCGVANNTPGKLTASQLACVVMFLGVCASEPGSS
jgi:hypothetical protein